MIFLAVACVLMTLVGVFVVVVTRRHDENCDYRHGGVVYRKCENCGEKIHGGVKGWQHAKTGTGLCNTRAAIPPVESNR